jgi:hypothetical protein
MKDMNVFSDAQTNGGKEKWGGREFPSAPRSVKLMVRGDFNTKTGTF